MASPSAWNSGWNIGAEIAQEHRAQKQGRANQLWEDKRGELNSNIANLTAKYSTLLGPNGEDTPESLKVKYALNQAELAKGYFANPPKTPGAMQRLESLLHLTKNPQAQTVTTETGGFATMPGSDSRPDLPGVTTAPVTPPAPPAEGAGTAARPPATMARTMVHANPQGLIEAGNIPIDNRPVVRNADGSESTEYSVSFGDDKGREVLVPTVVNGKFLTPDGNKPQTGSPEEQAMFQRAWQHYLQTGENLGKFDSDANADAYAQVLHNRGQGSAASSPMSLRAAAQQLQNQAQAPELAASPEVEAGLGAGPGAKMPGQTYTVSTPAGTPRQLRDKAQRFQRAQQDVDALTAAAPISPGQQAELQAQAGETGKLASVQAEMQAFNTLKPDATPEEKSSYLNDLIQKYYGTTSRGSWTNISGKINGQPVTLRYDKISNRTTYQTGESVSPEDLANFAPDTKTTASAQDQADYQSAVQHGYKGSMLQWKAEQSARGRAAAPKPQTPDQQFLSIEEKKAKGEPLTSDEQAFEKAYHQWQYIKTTEPRIAGYQALAWSRIVQVEVPGRPGEMTFMPAGVAYKSGMRGPSSLSHLMSVYYGTGKGGQDLLRFNTATHHLQLMATLADALNNGNIPAINRIANAWTTAVGGSAPTNFNGIRDAVAGELSRLYTGVGATEQEISNIESGVNNAQSPEQLAGIIQTDLDTMKGKIQASATQYMMGTEGTPAFPEDIVPPGPTAATSPAPATSGAGYIYAKDQKGKLHRAKPGIPLPKGWTLVNGPSQ